MTERPKDDESSDVPQVAEEASILGIILEVGAMEEAIEAGQLDLDHERRHSEDVEANE